jgi:hypothetical protein
VARRKPTVASYRADPLYPRIARATDDLLRRGNVVAPVDVLIVVELLTRERLEDWRRGRVPFLARVINCNLTRLGRLLRILRFHAHDLNLKPSWTAYMRWGKGPTQRLRFTKTGDLKVEAQNPTEAAHDVLVELAAEPSLASYQSAIAPSIEYQLERRSARGRRCSMRRSTRRRRRGRWHDR